MGNNCREAVALNGTVHETSAAFDTVITAVALVVTNHETSAAFDSSTYRENAGKTL